jgi:hypothetical protein
MIELSPNELPSKDLLNTQLESAVIARDINEVAIIIEQGANAHLLSDRLCLIAIGRGYHDILVLLLSNSALPDGTGGSLIACAIKYRDVRSVKTLVSFGASLILDNVDFIKLCKAASAVDIWRYLYQQGLEPSDMGWQYFAGVMVTILNILRMYLGIRK